VQVSDEYFTLRRTTILTTDTDLTLTFLGGAGEIGASCTLVEVGNTRILVDCGVRFNAGTSLPDLSRLHGLTLDAIAVTHAHSDHTGGLPVVCDAYSRAPVYATPPTRDIAMILLSDALKLMKTEESEGELPLYAEKQVTRLADAFTPVHHGDSVTVGEMTLTFLPAGHILGAAMMHIATPAGNVLFTGDYSVSAQHTVPALSRPYLHTDLLVTESTYGDRLHEDRDAAEKRLVTCIGEIVSEGGQVLVPAFAVGRAQEILLVLKRALRNHALPEVPVYVDGMVRSVCEVYGQHERYVSRGLSHDIRRATHPFYTNGITPIERREDRQRALDSGPAVIVASSGMLSGGASVFYAQALMNDPKNAVLITGYQDEESPGRKLLDLAGAEGPREVTLSGRTQPVRCRFEKYGLSAHADRMQMVGLIESLRPRTVVLVHGDDAARNSLADGLSAGDLVLADTGRVITRSYPVRRKSGSPSPLIRRLDLASGRQLLGPAREAPVHARQVAEAWYGKSVNSEMADRLADELCSLGLVRRDDHRRQMLYVLPPSETDAFPAEAALEARLKQENPKGKLLSFCMRERIPAPVFAFGEKDAFHTAYAGLDLNDARIESGVHTAATKKTAEQLAAQALLRIIEKKNNQSTAATWIDEETARALKAENPKGRLMEWCTEHNAESPRFDIRAVVEGFHAEASVALAGHTSARSGLFGAATKKIAEQAAAKQLIIRLQENPETDIGPTTAAASRPPEVPAGTSPSFEPGRDPMMLLNEMRQLGLLNDFGYEVQTGDGPSHQPEFHIVGWAVLENGDEVDAEEVIAASKKAGRRQAAEALVEALRERGLLAKG
jgi:predicted metal-dependent RNase/dsRNA-specific ribonuclease